jgi:hypothetical protein
VSAQWWVVVPLVAAAVLYAAWRLLPGAWQARIRGQFGLPPPTPPPGACADCSAAHASRKTPAHGPAQE